MRLSTLHVYRDNNTAVSLCMIFVCPRKHMQRCNWTRISEPAAWASYFWHPETQTPLPASSNSRACSANSSLHHSYVYHEFGHQSKLWRYNTSIHSKHFITKKRSEKGVGCSHLPCAILQRYHTPPSVIR